MTCHQTTQRQQDYAKSLVSRLKKRDPDLGSKYKKKVKDCICIQEMSELIDDMKDELGS